MFTILRKIKLYGPVQFIKFAAGEWFYRIYSQWLKNSFSQYGEDSIIDGILKGKKRGFYIDIGANDPIRFNNTYRFYKKGWRGINIEPNITCLNRLKEKRPKDINLGVGIAKKQSQSFFFEFLPDTLSTFSDSSARRYKRSGFELVKKHKVDVLPLFEVIAKHAKGKTIDLFSVDTEGNDLEVLQSNDWKKFVPKIICVEISARKLTRNVEGRVNHKLVNYLKRKGYKMFVNNGVNAIFVHD